jgi:hypothetical protein
MKMASGKIVATFGLLALMAVTCNLAQAQRTSKAVVGQVDSSMDVVQKLQATADQAMAKINASTAEKAAMIKAVRTKNTDQTRAILLMNGFTPKQLEGAKIETIDRSTTVHLGESIKISVSCCPPTITITITS